MSDLDDLAAARQTARVTRTRAQKPAALSNRAIFGILVLVVFLFCVIAAIRNPRALVQPSPPSRSPADLADESVLYNDFTAAFTPDAAYEVAADRFHEPLRQLDYKMVNMRVMFTQGLRLPDQPWIMQNAFDTISGRQLSDDETAARLDELRDRIAAAKTLVRLSESPAAREALRKSVHVRAYMKRDGTVVRAHDRSQ